MIDMVKWNIPKRRTYTGLETALKWIGRLLLVGVILLVGATIAQAADCIDNGNVTLTWNANPEPDVAGYEVYRSVTGLDGAYEKISGETLVADTTYTDSALPDGEYAPFYKLAAVDFVCNRSILSGASAGTVRHDTVAPSAPVAPVESITP